MRLFHHVTIRRTDHKLDAADVMTQPEVKALVLDLEQTNVVCIRGRRYVLTQYSAPYPDGHLDAHLMPEDCPF
jgi:hypothetical protein